MRIQSVVLEYHCDISVFRLYIVYNSVTDLKGTTGDLLKTCDHTKGGRFTTSGRSYKDDKLFIFNFQVKVFYCFKTIRVSFVDVLQ